MALNDQMQQMVQQDIQDAETRPKDEILQEQMEGLKTAGRTVRDVAIESIPGVSEALAEKRVDEALQRGDTTGAMIEGAAGLMGAVPILGDAAGRALRSATRSLRKDAKLKIDNPGYNEFYGETYAQTKQKASDEVKQKALDAGETDTYRANLGTTEGITGYANEVTFKPEELKDLPGAMGEEKIRSSGTKLENLKKTIKKEGYKPDTIMIHVREDGQPFIVEGNHRLAEAVESGRKTIKADVRYLRGAEEKAGPLDPRFIFPDKRAATKKFRNVSPLEIGASEAAQEGKFLKNYDKSIVDNMKKESRAATAGTKKADALIDAEVSDGTKVGIRLNLNSTIPNMPRGLDKLQTLHKNNYNGKALSYRSFATVEDVTFNVNQKGRQGIAAKVKGIDVPEAKNKFPAMSVDGRLNNARNVLDEVDDEVVEIGFNPVTGHLFTDLATGQAVKGADVATVVGDRVYAKGVTYLKKADAPTPLDATDGTKLSSEVRYRFNKGGAIPMKNMAEQMELFEPVERGFNEGGLAEEGGSVDPISGNDVPPGSTQEEVRDDIPAQLSEGEFVFPADVVRYIGLEKLMMMRQEAKMGLAQMEAMGQMGNGDEATMPDNLPFAMYDLEIEDDGLEMNTGGAVPPTGTMNPQTNQFQPMGTSPVPLGTAASPIEAASANVSTVDPNLAGTSFQPVTVPSITMPFQQAIGSGVRGVDYTVVSYTDKDGNPVTLHKRKDGTIVDPATNAPVDTEAMGYTLTSDVVQETAAPKAQVQTARLLNQDGREDKADVDARTTDVTGVKYNRSGLTSSLRDAIDKYGAGFGTLKDAFNPQIYDRAQVALGLKDDIDAKTNAITSASFGGVLDNFRGGTRADGYTGENANTALDQLGRVAQDRLATVSRATVTRVQNIITSDGEALSNSETQAALEKALADQFELSAPQIAAIANAGGKYNQSQKLARYLSGEIAREETQKAVDKSMTDYAAMVSSKPELSKDDPSPDGYTGGAGASKADRESGAATQAAADSFTDKGYTDTSGEGGYGGP